VVTNLYATKAAQSFIASLLPLGNEVLVSITFIEAIVVEFARDFFAPVEEVEYVSTSLMMQSKYWPDRFSLSLSFVGIVLHIAHLLVQLVQLGGNEFPAFWRLLSGSSDFRHLRGNFFLLLSSFFFLPSSFFFLSSSPWLCSRGPRPQQLACTDTISGTSGPTGYWTPVRLNKAPFELCLFPYKSSHQWKMVAWNFLIRTATLGQIINSIFRWKRENC